MVVSGLLLVVLTFMAISMTQSKRSQGHAESTADAELALRLARQKLTFALSRAALIEPAAGASQQVVMRPYRFTSDGILLLDASGEPDLAPPATVGLSDYKLVLKAPAQPEQVLVVLGPAAAFSVERIGPGLLRFYLKAGQPGAEARELAFKLHLD